MTTGRHTKGPWSAWERRRLMAMWGEYSAREIQRVIRRSEGGIHRKTQRLGLTPQGPKEGDDVCSVHEATKRIGTSYCGFRTVMRECAIATHILYPVRSRRKARPCPKKGVDFLAVEAAFTQRDRRTVLAVHAAARSGVDWHTLQRRGEARGVWVRRTRTAPHLTRYPVGLCDELVANVDGSWCAVWRAVLAAGKLPVAPWVAALAVHDLAFPDSSQGVFANDWIYTVLDDTVLAVLRRIVRVFRPRRARSKKASGLSAVRCNASEAPVKTA